MLEKMEGRKLKETEVVQLLKAKHLQTPQRGSGETGTDVSVYTEWNLQAATQIYTKLHSDPVICVAVAKREACSGSDSCFNSLVKLEKLAQKPSCSASRRWIFQWMDDMLSHGMLRDEDLTKKEIHGGSGSLGELKWKIVTSPYWRVISYAHHCRCHGFPTLGGNRGKALFHGSFRIAIAMQDDRSSLPCSNKLGLEHLIPREH